MTSQLPHFWCLFLSCQQQKKNTEKGAVVTSLRSFLFCDDFTSFQKMCSIRNHLTVCMWTVLKFLNIFFSSLQWNFHNPLGYITINWQCFHNLIPIFFYFSLCICNDCQVSLMRRTDRAHSRTCPICRKIVKQTIKAYLWQHNFCMKPMNEKNNKI